MLDHATSRPPADRRNPRKSPIHLAETLEITEGHARCGPTVNPEQRPADGPEQDLVDGHLHRSVKGLIGGHEIKLLEHPRHAVHFGQKSETRFS
jgi:hypothetical protein